MQAEGGRASDPPSSIEEQGIVVLARQKFQE